ncbi:T9SS type A sorting domain-containing protein [Winogradskyella sp.]|jgi:hypothetical protein|uniref:T9SS type A sorting domain-containing protein n=1 Tax=Winogradskyella sp. TaxID=1883156 RepID=UPI0025D0E780|nr:T9SS type A sorting domain-containing protein [Winogradskyella sp.]MCT4629950.1 T9SS type A sorting domain-containing protein [Winogradskyella sp.]
MYTLTSSLKIFIFSLCIVFTSVCFGQNSGSSSSLPDEENLNITTQNQDDDRRKIRLGFTAPNTLHRQLLLTEDENATSGIDWGYDGEYYATEYDDMYWLIEGQLFTIQGTDIIDENSSFPLGFHTNIDGVSTIGIDALENIDDDFDLYLLDNESGTNHNLRDGDYEFYTESGVYLERFQIAFQSPTTLSTTEKELDQLDFYYAMNRKKIVVLNPTNIELKNIDLYNITGQKVDNYETWSGTYNEYQINNLSAGTYIVKVNTLDNNVVTKKIIVK